MYYLPLSLYLGRSFHCHPSLFLSAVACGERGWFWQTDQSTFSWLKAVAESSLWSWKEACEYKLAMSECKAVTQPSPSSPLSVSLTGSCITACLYVCVCVLIYCGLNPLCCQSHFFLSVRNIWNRKISFIFHRHTVQRPCWFPVVLCLNRCRAFLWISIGFKSYQLPKCGFK